MSFWQYFEDQAAPKLAFRAHTFRAMFRYLDTLPGRLLIVETGCARRPGAWGDGQSTVLFDRYITARDDASQCHSIDVSAESVAACRALVSHRVTVHEGDSVQVLHRLCRGGQLPGSIDLLYLDSFDVDFTYWFASAAHHLKEFVAAAPLISPRTLVAVDDSPLTAVMVSNDGAVWQSVQPPVAGGKGRLLAEYAAAVGATPRFADYQVGWTGF
jgi:hypothetical protein